MKSARALELHAFLEGHGVTAQQASDPTAKLQDAWDLVFFLSLDDKPARPLQQWVDRVKGGQIKGRFIVLYHHALAEAWRAVLDPEIEIGDDHDLPESLAYLFEENTELPEGGPTAPLSEDFSGMESSAFLIEGTGTVEGTGLFAASEEAGGARQSVAVDAASLSLGGLNLDVATDFETRESAHAAPADDAPVDFGDMLSNLEVGAVVESSIQHPDSDISEPLAGRETFNAEINVDSVFSEEMNRSTQIGVSSVSIPMDPPEAEEEPERGAGSPFYASEAMADGGASLSSSSDVSTLQKYAALKEREAREKEATIQVLKGQLGKLETKLSRSDAERRRLTLENDEMKNQIGTLEESLSQKQFHIQKMEGQHQEEQRGLSLRLDNALFQASKAQNKLEEFRERVRTDFVKIRAQERELFNKLELQKRDAEALLASKDEQLLNQKREIDRLQYELESLRERMVEETEKAEERASRLMRAVQSLKLANDMLSGLSEEVLPAAGDSFVGRGSGGEDAA